MKVPIYANSVVLEIYFLEITVVTFKRISKKADSGFVPGG